MNRRELLTGAAASALMEALPRDAEALTAGQRVALLGGVLWTPLNLNALLVDWWDAKYTSSFTLNSGNVAGWADRKSGTVASQGTGANQPAYSSSTGLLSFASGNQSLNVSGLPTAYDVAFVGSPLAPGGFRTFLWAASGQQMLLNTGATSVGIFDGAFKQAGALTWPAQLGILYMSLISGSNVSMGRDGTTPLSAVTSPNLTSTAIATIGNSGGGGQAFGSMGDIIATSSGLSLSNQNKITGFLAWKYSLQGNLPSTHPYKNRPPYTSDP